MIGYRPFVTLPTGDTCFVAANVRIEEEKQAVLNFVGNVVQNTLGMAAQGLSPQRMRELSTKVEFFRVAQG